MALMGVATVDCTAFPPSVSSSVCKRILDVFPAHRGSPVFSPSRRICKVALVLVQQREAQHLYQLGQLGIK